MTSPLTTVFVYGTLRKGFKYHSLLQGAHFVGSATTCECYALYLAAYPCLFKGKAVSRIRGEIYEIDQSTLEQLDELENHPYEYRREQVQVILDNGRKLPAWVYFYPEPIGILEPSGDYAEHS
jgi:gamma-glutamylcyclotransferase (GGCT)/AIG2-like uncharacterized protein YtfP